MANIRTLNDDRNDNRRPLNQGVNTLGSNLLQRGVGDPMKESFWDMLHINLCPSLTLLSFSIFLSIALTLVFVTQISISGINTKGEFLEVQKTGLTAALSATYDSVIEKRQIYRLLSFWLVHENLPRLVSTVIMLVIWGSYTESFLGLWRSLLIFILSSVAGGSFGVLFADPKEYLMGASVGLYGLLGAALGFLIFNWNAIPDSRFPKLFMFWMIVIIIAFSLLMGSSASAVLLEVGGIIAGIACGLFLSPKYAEEHEMTVGLSAYEKSMWILGISLYVFFIAIDAFFIWLLKKK